MPTCSRGDAFNLAQTVAACPYTTNCRAQFEERHKAATANRPLRFADVPSPDFIGSRYSGLLIVGGNPGLAHRPIHHANDDHMFALQRKIAKGDQAAFDELMAFMPSSMAHWPQVVNVYGRDRLQYDIEDIAYIDIVKCGTSPSGADTMSLFRRTNILDRCWNLHTRQLLELLRPTHILALWKPTLGILAKLGYPLAGIMVGYHSGARNLTLDQRYVHAHAVVDDFYGRRRGQ